MALSGTASATGIVQSAQLVVGAPGEDSNATTVGGDGSLDVALGVDSGAAYLFLFGQSIGQLAYFKASNTGANDAFGSSVAISGDRIVVGAPFESNCARGVNGRYGDKTCFRSGAAYVYSLAQQTLSFSAYLKAANTDPGDLFGSSVAISEDVVLVGAPGEDSSAVGIADNSLDNSLSNVGGAYSFVESSDGWAAQGYLKPSNPVEQGNFGSCVAISKGTMAVAAIGENGAATGINVAVLTEMTAESSGAIYLFR
jgi:hypothetical protein